MRLLVCNHQENGSKHQRITFRDSGSPLVSRSDWIERFQIGITFPKNFIFP